MIDLNDYRCKRCNSEVNNNISKDQYSHSEYFAFCPKCDEDMYEFELTYTEKK